MECKYCGGELYFIKQLPKSPHRTGAFCSKCRNKDGKPMFDSGLSDKQRGEIYRLYPYTTVKTYNGRDVNSATLGKVNEWNAVNFIVNYKSLKTSHLDEVDKERVEKFIVAEKEGRMKSVSSPVYNQTAEQLSELAIEMLKKFEGTGETE